jgi:hypothetical protein
LWGTLQALHEIIPLSFPIDSPDELNRISAEFGSDSDGIMLGCVGAIDGLLKNVYIYIYRNVYVCTSLNRFLYTFICMYVYINIFAYIHKNIYIDYIYAYI